MNNVEVTATGKYYKIINKISNLNISINNVRYSKDHLSFKTSYDNYIKLKKYLPSYQFEITKYYGLKNLKLLIKKYIFYIISFFIGLLFLLFVSNIMIEVRVIHSSKYIRTLVLDALDDRGITRLSFKKKYEEIEKIKKDILNEYKDDLEWLEIEVHGMK